MKKVIWVFVLALFAFAITGCNDDDLKSIRNYAKTSEEACDQISLFGEKLAASIQRTRELKIYSLETDIAPSALLPDSRLASFSAKLKLLGQSLKNYFLAMRAVAGEKAINYEKSTNSLKKEVETTKLFKKEELNKIALLLNVTLAAYQNDLRRREIRKVIGNSNQSYRDVLSLLEYAINADNWPLLLQIEEDRLQKTFKTIEKKYSEMEPLAFTVLKLEWQQRSVNLNKAREALKALSETINTMKESHQELYNERNRLNKVSVKDLVNYYMETLEPLIETMKKAE